MKKLIAVLAVFAVFAGMAFAQDAGTWAVSGSGYIGARVDFLPLFNDEPANRANILASRYDLGDGEKANGDNGDIRGNFSLSYQRGILKTTLSFNQRGKIGASLEVTGENWNFTAKRDLTDLLDNYSAFNSDLWGNYTFNVLEGLEVEAAIRKERNIWNSEGVVDTFAKHDGPNALGKNYFLVNFKPIKGLEVGFKLPNVFRFPGIGGDAGTAGASGGQLQYRDTSGATPAWRNVSRDGDVYYWVDADGDLHTWFVDDIFAGSGGGLVTSGDFRFAPSTGASGGVDFLEGALRKMVFGAKLTGDSDAAIPIDVAFQLALNNYSTGGATSMDWKTGYTGLYLEAKAKINSEMWASFGFTGMFGFNNGAKKDDDAPGGYEVVNSAKLIFGAKFGYTSANEALPINFDIMLKYYDNNTAYNSLSIKQGTETVDLAGIAGQAFRIEANVGYKLIADYLKFNLGMAFEFPFTSGDLKDKDKFPSIVPYVAQTRGLTTNPSYETVNNMLYRVRPEIQFNFLGTGAGNWDTGFAIGWSVEGRAEAAKQTSNALYVAFKWKF